MHSIITRPTFLSLSAVTDHYSRALLDVFLYVVLQSCSFCAATSH
jgi:hypothetical protein